MLYEFGCENGGGGAYRPVDVRNGVYEEEGDRTNEGGLSGAGGDGGGLRV